MIEEENLRLEATNESTRSQLEAMATAHDTQRRLLETYNTQLLDKIHELTHIQREIHSALETWPSWLEAPLSPHHLVDNDSKEHGGGGGGSGGGESGGADDALISDDLTGMEAFANIEPWLDAELDESITLLPGPWSELTFWLEFFAVCLLRFLLLLLLLHFANNQFLRLCQIRTIDLTLLLRLSRV